MNKMRTEIREKSKVDGNARILRSLQSCLSIKENFAVLDQYLKKLTKGSSLFSKVKALKEIL